MQDYLDEFTTIPKGELKTVDVYAGKPFYTSNVLRERYLEAMEKSGRATPVINKIRDLVQREIIVPVYKSKSILRSIFKLQPVQFSGILGAAIPNKKLIYIFVESSANIFSFSNNSALSKVSIHELIHLLSFTKPQVFMSIFKDDLKKFYNTYFCKLLSCNPSDIPDSDINKFVEFLFWKSEQKMKMLSNAEINKYYILLDEIYKSHTTLNEKTFEDLLKTYFVSFKLIQKLESYGQGHKIIQVATAFKHIFIPFYTTYKNVFAIDPLKENQFVYQEMFAPSEVISTQAISKTPSQNIYKAINKL